MQVKNKQVADGSMVFITIVRNVSGVFDFDPAFSDEQDRPFYESEEETEDTDGAYTKFFCVRNVNMYARVWNVIIVTILTLHYCV